MLRNIEFDVAGERFGYDAENHQKEFFAEGNSSINPDATYFHDGSGLRVKKITSTETTVFVYDVSSKLIAEYSTALAETQQVSYLTTDHLGSPRVITNENGAVTSRKYFTAFGEESATAQRTSTIGYSGTTEIRQGYTGYEKDDESGLDFAQARYYNSVHGRYTSVDPLTASASIRDPQTFNRYSYVLNSPYKFTDPLGLIPETTGACGTRCRNSFSGEMRDGAFTGRNPFSQHADEPEPPAPPQIKVEGVTLVMRTAKLDSDGNFIIANGQQVYEETVLAVGSARQDFGGSDFDFEVNINRAIGELNIGGAVYLKVDLSIVEGPNRAAFDDNATTSTGADGSPISQKDTIISSDGKRMTVNIGLMAGPEGMLGGKGKIGTVTLKVRASYVDEYDSRTNQILLPKVVNERVRISLVNSRPNPFLKQPY